MGKRLGKKESFGVSPYLAIKKLFSGLKTPIFTFSKKVYFPSKTVQFILSLFAALF